MTVEIRPVPPAEMRAWFDSVMVAFGEDFNEDQWKLDQLTLEPERILGGYDGNKIIGGGGVFSFQMTVPGGVAPVGGVTMVGVLPTHRRQGVLTALMARQLADVKAAGEPMAALWASEGSIYQRFGYGLATANGSVDVERDRSAFRKPVVADGQVELRDVDSARPSIMRIYDEVRARTPAFYARSSAWYDVLLSDAEFRRRGAGQRFNAVLVRDGIEVGYVLYRIKAEWLDKGPSNTVIVLELMGIDPQAIQQLWRYIFGIDLTTRIRCRIGPADHPLLLMAAEPRRIQLQVRDGMWLRIVDVPAALEARGYATDGAIVLDVTDEFMPEVAGRWRLTVSGGRGTAEATSEPADLQLEIQDLAAAYMGGFSFGSLGRAARTVELTPGARARADSMFAAETAPWCPEVF